MLGSSLLNALSFKEIIMAGDGEVKVLSTWVSPFGLSVQIALEEKHIKYDYQEENLANKSQLLLQMNPVHKKIPVFIHNGRPVVESLIILQYIDEAWQSSGGSLLPSEPYDRATARFWADFIGKKIYDAGARIVTTKGEEQEEAKRELVEYLVLVEGALTKLSDGKPYFGGQTFGFLDIVFVSFTPWFPAYESIGNFKIPLEEKCPNVDAWIKRCRERESVKKVLPDPRKVVEFGYKLRKMFAAGRLNK